LSRYGATTWFKELNPRRRVYVEIPKPARVELNVILPTPERALVCQYKPDAEGLISIIKCLKAKGYVFSLPRRVLVELPRPSALRKRLMHFPFEIIIWDTQVYFRIRCQTNIPVHAVIVIDIAKCKYHATHPWGEYHLTDRLFV
jgi:hypothetical protein